MKERREKRTSLEKHFLKHIKEKVIVEVGVVYLGNSCSNYPRYDATFGIEDAEKLAHWKEFAHVIKHHHETDKRMAADIVKSLGND